MGPISTTRPRYITATRSATVQASPRSCVTIISEMLSSSRNFISSARISPRTDASRFDTGSSAMITFGIEHEGARDHDALALPAGELVRVVQEEALGRAQARRGTSAWATRSSSVSPFGPSSILWIRSPSATIS